MISDDWLNLDTKCSIPFWSKFFLLSKTRHYNRYKWYQCHVEYTPHWYLKGLKRSFRYTFS